MRLHVLIANLDCDLMHKGSFDGLLAGTCCLTLAMAFLRATLVTSVRFLPLSGKLVIGDRPWCVASHFSIAQRSYVCPSPTHSTGSTVQSHTQGSSADAPQGLVRYKIRVFITFHDL
jgi:hypothetical protein